MVIPQWQGYEEELKKIQSVVDRLVWRTNAKVVFIVDKNVQLVAASGDVDNLDTTSLASLTAGNIASSSDMAKLLKEHERAMQVDEGEKANIYMQIVENRVVLVVIFDSDSTPPDVRLGVTKANQEFRHIFRDMQNIFISMPRSRSGHQLPFPFAEISEEDIDKMFND